MVNTVATATAHVSTLSPITNVFAREASTAMDISVSVSF